MAVRARQESDRLGRTNVKPSRSAAKRRTASASSNPSNRGGMVAKRPQAPGAVRRPVPGRRQEIIALVLFGLAVFCLFVLVAGGTGGVVGRGLNAGVIFAFGRLAFLLPLFLLALAATTVLAIKLHRSLWFGGAMVFLFGLLVLVASGFMPVGSHGEDTFVRAVYETRAGALGEVIYAILFRLAGKVGVGVIGWVTLLAGFSLATGVTVRRLALGTKKAAEVVKAGAERSTLVRRNRQDRLDDTVSAHPFATGGFDGLTTGGPARHGASSPWFGPRDLVAEATGVEQEPGVSGPFVGEFEDWADGRTVSRSPVAVDDSMHGGRCGVLDGAQAFSDLYGATPAERAVSNPAAGAGSVAALGGGAGAMGLVTAPGTAGAGAVASVERGVAGEASPAGALAAATTSRTESGEVRAAVACEADRQMPGQETLPGLARQPRQTVLPVTEPAYVLPESHLLRKSAPTAITGQGAERDTAAVLLHALAQFGVEAKVIGMVVGPRVTRYELQLAPGTKVSKVSNLKDDLAYALASTEIRILAPIPGKSAVGVEVPNQRPDFVTLGDIYREFPKTAGPLMVWLGKDISGKAVYTDLTRLPHLLIAGTTGSGKSGCVNCLVSSVLLRSNPEQVRMIMIDPKKVELSHYDRIPHLLVPVVTNMKDAAGVLYNVAKEMEDRYELMELEHARNLAEMNKSRARRGERALPYILVVIDELADLMMVSPQEVEEYVIRLAQKSRAVGIHLVVATQRPSADVITGMIKANIPSRIAFAVSSQTDSRVILDVNGAETLLGMGDMLFKPLGSSHLQRVQGAYITEEEIAVLVNHWRHQAEPEFREELLRRPAEPNKRSEEDLFDPDSDDLLGDAARLVIETGSASVSMLQRRLRVGYTRAGRLIDMLERRGIVGPWEGSKPRQILVDADDFDPILAALRVEADADGGTLCE
ncbi:MAG: DNA translocase FtsK [Actinobacteria bacterium]|nr:DNA translocase FtsK [Actinomycetota bacterium]